MKDRNERFNKFMEEYESFGAGRPGDMKIVDTPVTKVEVVIKWHLKDGRVNEWPLEVEIREDETEGFQIYHALETDPDAAGFRPTGREITKILMLHENKMWDQVLSQPPSFGEDTEYGKPEIEVIEESEGNATIKVN